MIPFYSRNDFLRTSIKIYMIDKLLEDIFLFNYVLELMVKKYNMMGAL